MGTRPGPELEALIGEAAYVRLAEAFGGTRLYVPANMKPDHEIVAAIGSEAAARLVARMAPDVIKVPLARELRARHYRAAGRSHSQIARTLGITENAVDKLFARMEDAPRKGSGIQQQPVIDDDQLDLFHS